MVFALWLESCCQIGKLWNHRYWLVVLTGDDGITPSATCSSLGTRAGAEVLRPTKAPTDLLVVPDTAQEMVQCWLPAAPQGGVQARLDFAPMVWLLPWKFMVSSACAHLAG